MTASYRDLLYFSGSKQHSQSLKRLANEFSPLTEAQQQFVGNLDSIRNCLVDVIRKECSDSSIVKLHDMEVPVVEDTCKDRDLPPTPSEAAQTLLKSETAVTADDLCKKMDLTELQLTILTSGTIEQSQCTAWKEHRKRRCMSSISKRIYTRTKTVLNNPNTDVTALVIEVMGLRMLSKNKGHEAWHCP